MHQHTHTETFTFLVLDGYWYTQGLWVYMRMRMRGRQRVIEGSHGLPYTQVKCIVWAVPWLRQCHSSSMSTAALGCIRSPPLHGSLLIWVTNSVCRQRGGRDESPLVSYVTSPSGGETRPMHLSYHCFPAMMKNISFTFTKVTIRIISSFCSVPVLLIIHAVQYSISWSYKDRHFAWGFPLIHSDILPCTLLIDTFILPA